MLAAKHIVHGERRGRHIVERQHEAKKKQRRQEIDLLRNYATPLLFTASTNTQARNNQFVVLLIVLRVCTHTHT